MMTKYQVRARSHLKKSPSQMKPQEQSSPVQSDRSQKSGFFVVRARRNQVKSAEKKSQGNVKNMTELNFYIKLVNII